MDQNSPIPESNRVADKTSDNLKGPRDTKPGSAEDVRGKVERNELADPSKLHEGAYQPGTKAGADRSPDKSKTKDEDKQVLDFSTDIYHEQKAKISGDKDSADSYKFTGLDIKGLPTLAEVNSFNNPEYADKFWNKEFAQKLSSEADATLKQLRGPETAVAQKQFDDNRQKLIGNHKGGDHWTEDGTQYFLDKNGDLLSKNQSGVHYQGADGLRFDGNGKEATLTKDGETVIRHGDQYLKKYKNGEEVEIVNKGDKEALLRLQNMVVEQRKKAVPKLNKTELDQAAKEHSKIITGTDGVAVMNVNDQTGNVVAKSSKEDGATIRLNDGSMFKVLNGQVSSIDAHGIEHEVADSNLPDGIKRGEKDSIKVGTVTLTADNILQDTVNSVLMQNMEAKVTAETAAGPVVTEVVDGTSTVKTADHRYVYDSKQGKYSVFNADNTVDLTFDNATSTLITDGVTFTPSGTQIGGTHIGTDGRISESRSSSDRSRATAPEKEAAKQAAATAAGELAQVCSDIAGYSATGADVAKLHGDLAMLAGVKGLLASFQDVEELTAQISNRVSAQESAIANVLGTAVKQANANETASELTGKTNHQLAQTIATSGGDLRGPDLQKYGLLPMEIVDSSRAA